MFILRVSDGRPVQLLEDKPLFEELTALRVYDNVRCFFTRKSDVQELFSWGETRVIHDAPGRENLPAGLLNRAPETFQCLVDYVGRVSKPGCILAYAEPYDPQNLAHVFLVMEGRRTS